MSMRLLSFLNLNSDVEPFALILIFLLIFGFTYWIIRRSVENHQHWQHSFDFTFSAEEFYQSVQTILTKHEIPNIKFSRVTYSQYSSFGFAKGGREYLHIEKGEYIYDVCAAPYGTGFFVSLWYVERPGFIKKLMRKSPVLKVLADYQTYYEIDTDGMANGAIRGAFEEAIEELTTAKGARKLSDAERKFF